MSGVTLLDRNEWFEIASTPIIQRIAFANERYYRIAAVVKCRACGKGMTQKVRAQRILLGRDQQPVRGPDGRIVLVPRPDPANVDVVVKILLCAAEHRLGCYDNAVSDLGYVMDRGRPGRHTQRGKCGLNGKKKCVCGYARKNHNKGCPYILYPRHARMILAGMSSSTQVRGLVRP